MAKIHNDEFRREAVRIALSSTEKKLIIKINFPEDGINAPTGCG
jgi:hypothetical protein